MVSGDYFRVLQVPVLQGRSCRDDPRQLQIVGGAREPQLRGSVFQGERPDRPARRHRDRQLRTPGRDHRRRRRRARARPGVAGRADGLPVRPHALLARSPLSRARRRPAACLDGGDSRGDPRNRAGARRICGAPAGGISRRVDRAAAAERDSAVAVRVDDAAAGRDGAATACCRRSWRHGAARSGCEWRWARGRRRFSSRWSRRRPQSRAWGIAAGVGGAAALAHLMASLVFGIPPRDPLTFAAAPVVLAIVAAVASIVPARRAATRRSDGGASRGLARTRSTRTDTTYETRSG